MSNSFEDLEVWKMGKNIVIETYQISTHFPKEESFILASQIRRAALSVPANIAEGFGRYHYLDKAKFYLNARGSLYELKSHLLIAQELGYFSQSQSISSLLITIDKLGVKLNNLISSSRKLSKASQ
jgi:four helix bundle protein